MASDEQSLQLHLQTKNELQEIKINNDEAGFRIIGVSLLIDKVESIDVVSQSFIAELHCHFGVEGTEKDYNEYKSNKTNYQPQFDPYKAFTFTNLKSLMDIKEPKYFVLALGEPDFYGIACTKIKYPYMICSSYVIVAEWTEQFKLKHFPFDCQDLQISLQLTQGTKYTFCYAGYYEAGNYHGFSINRGASMFLNYDCLNAKIESFVKIMGSGNKYGTVNFRMKLSRKWEVYFWKIIVFVFIISLSSFIVYSLDEDDVADQYGLLFTLLLTDVAFQFVISTYIPALPYLTLLDKYVVLSFFIIFVVIIQIFIYSVVDIESEIKYTINIICISLFFISQIIFGLYCWERRKYENKKLEMDMFDYRNKGYEDSLDIQSIYPKISDLSMDKTTAEFVSKLGNRDFTMPEIKSFKSE